MLTRPRDALRRRFHVSDRSFDGIGRNRAEYSIWSKPLDHIDGFVLKTHRTSERDNRATVSCDQGQFVGKQSPPSADQSGAKRALTGARWRGQDRCPPAALDRRCMNDQVLISLGVDAPIQTTLEHSMNLVQRHWSGWPIAIDLHGYVLTKAAAPASRFLESNVKIRKVYLIRNRKRAVEAPKRLGQLGDSSLYLKDKRTNSKKEARIRQSVRQFKLR